MSAIKLKLECIDKTWHRYRTADPYDAWKWCEGIRAQQSLECVVELVPTGHIAEAALDFAKLFEGLRKDPAAEGQVIKLRLVPRKTVSFRLMRDVASRSFILSQQDKVYADISKAIDDSQTVAVALIEAKEAAVTTLPAKDAYTPEFSKASTYQPRQTEKFITEPSQFILARDADPTFNGIRLYTDMI